MIPKFVHGPSAQCIRRTERRVTAHAVLNMAESDNSTEAASERSGSEPEPASEQPSAGGSSDAASSSDEVVVPRTTERYRHRSSRRGGRRRRTVPLSKRRGLDRALRYGVLGLVLAAPLLIGGVHFTTAVGLAVASLGLGALAIVIHWRRGTRLGIVGGALTIWVAVTALQLVPLPIGIVEMLAPETARHYQRAWSALGESPGAVPLSLSPNRTALALWQALAITGLFVATRLHFRKRERFAWLVPRLVLVGMAFAFISALQTALFEPTSVLGVYRPLQPLEPTPLVTTLVNPNHAAAFFGALAPVALGYGLACREPGQRYTYLLFYIVLSVATFMMLSRGAILTWALSHGVFVFLLKSSSMKRRSLALGIAALVLMVVAVGVTIGYRALAPTFESMVSSAESVSSELTAAPDDAALEAHLEGEPIDDEEAALRASVVRASESERFEKVLIFKDVWPIIGTYAPVGIGRGAFGDVYPGHATHGMQRTMRHAENEYLELVVEYGPVVALVLLGLLAAGLLLLFSRTDWREPERPLIAGVLTAVAFLAIHNLVDFNLRFPGVGFLAAVLLGAIAARASRYASVRRARDGGRTEGSGSWQHRVEGLQRVVGWVAMGTLLTASVIAVVYIGSARAGASGDDLAQVRQTVESLGESSDGTPEARRDELLSAAGPALRRRPVDGYLHLLVGIGMLRTGGDSLEHALPWLELAQRHNPTDYRTHLLLGRVHAARGDHAAAARELSLAAGLDRRASYDVARTVAEVIEKPVHLEAALSEDPDDWTVLGLALIEARRFADAIALAERLQARAPDKPHGLDLLVRSHLALGIPEAAIEPSQELIERFGDAPISYLRRAEVEARLGDLAAADETLEQGIQEHPRSLALLFTRLELLIRKFRPAYEDEAEWHAAIQRTLEKLRPVALSRVAQRARYHYLRGESLQVMEEPRQALRAYEAALRHNERYAPAMIGLFEVALTLGDVERAERAIEDMAPYVNPAFLKEQRRKLDVRREALENRMLNSPMFDGSYTLPGALRPDLAPDALASPPDAASDPRPRSSREDVGDASVDVGGDTGAEADESAADVTSPTD